MTLITSDKESMYHIYQYILIYTNKIVLANNEYNNDFLAQPGRQKVSRVFLYTKSPVYFKCTLGAWYYTTLDSCPRIQ